MVKSFTYVHCTIFECVVVNQISASYLGFRFYQAKIVDTVVIILQGSEVQFTSTTQCAYPRSPAMALGLTSAVSLMIAQIIINVTTGCICCKRSPRPSNSNWTIALVCFVVSW